MCRKVLICLLVSFFINTVPVMAHTPLCSCWEEGDGTIICEGGFSDGSSAQGVIVYVKDKDGKVLVKGQMDEFSEFNFTKPPGPFEVIFDAGEGHRVEVDGENIAE